MFDPERYRTEVLEPARRAGNVPPADLAVRYANPPGDTGFDQHVAVVVNHWGTLKQRRVYAALATALLAAHDELVRAGALTPAAFRAAGAADRRQAEEKLARRVAALAPLSPCVTARTVAALRDVAPGLSESDVIEAVGRRGLRVFDAWDLPDRAPKYRDIRANLSVLGLALSVHVVFGPDATFRCRDGFRLADGTGLTSAAIDAARAEVDRRAHDERATATRNVVAILSDLVTHGGLDELVRYELAERLRSGRDRGLPARPLADEAAELGLDRDEADELAVSVLEEARDPARSVATEVADLIATGHLRAAERLAETLETDTDLRDRIAELNRRVTDLAAEADRAADPERAAELLARALVLAADDPDLAARLDRIPPPPAERVTTEVDGDQVAVLWAASPARGGSIAYRVIRTVGRPATTPAAATAVANTPDTGCRDPNPPVGAPLYYAVFACRAERSWSPGTWAGPVLVTPEVTDLAVSAAEGWVSVGWTPPPGRSAVRVIRSTGHPPRSAAAGTDLPGVTDLGFVDRDVRTGVTYHYRIWCSYTDADGARHDSPGVVVSARPEPEPVPATNLAVTPVPDSHPRALRATWSAPKEATVSVRVDTEAPPWSAGTLLSAGDLVGHGRTVPGPVVDLGGDRYELVFPAQAGVRYYTVVTVGATRVAVGDTVRFGLAEPARHPHAERHEDVVRVSWVWPEHATAARVFAEPLEGGSRREVTRTRRSYDDDGGVELPVESGPLRIGVVVLVAGPGGNQLASAPVTTTVPGLPPRVYYQARPVRGRRSVVELEFSADRSCHLPALVLVRRPGTVLPLRAESGEVVGRVPARDLTRLEPVVVRVDVPKTREANRLACFTEDPDDGSVTLVPTW